MATRVGGVPELLESGAGLLVEPGRSAELASAVHRVLSDPALREGLTQNAYASLGRYSLDAMAEQVATVYRSCAHTLDRT